MWLQPQGLCMLIFIAGMSWRRQLVETCSPTPAAERAAVANGATVLHVAGTNGYRFQVRRISANRFQVKQIAANGTVEEAVHVL